jgi:uncharacterized membrane protein HdeD (DUF308 family)
MKFTTIRLKLYSSLLAALLYIFSFFNSTVSLAAQPEPIEINPITPFTDPQDIFDTLIPVVFWIGGLASFGYILYGAFKYVIAGDDPSKTAAARQTIINAVIGLVLLGLVFVIFRVATEVIGIDSLFFGGGTGRDAGGGTCDRSDPGCIY